MPGKFKDVTGQRFGKLVVRERAGSDKFQKATWRCDCDCGGTAVLATGAMRSGNTTSCGCVATESKRAPKSHGMSRTPIYETWSGMIKRCAATAGRDFEWYGRRGITVCERWRSFEAFYEDMGDRPSRRHSIDRIDNDRGYEPVNCRWATSSEQARNTRKQHGGHSDTAILCMRVLRGRGASPRTLARSFGVSEFFVWNHTVGPKHDQSLSIDAVRPLAAGRTG
jgi:hypothetical protein